MRPVCDAMMLLILMVVFQEISARGARPRPPRPPGPPRPRWPYWSFCEGSCSLGQGDCDKDTDCIGNLVCGQDNCRMFNSTVPKSADCCEEPEMCTNGWKPFNGRCYYFSGYKKSWNAAKTECSKLYSKAHLVSIGSKEEHEFISSNTGNSYTWIGGNDIDAEGKWTWSDGRPWGYSNWYSWEPDNSNNEDCALVWNNYWWDNACSKNYHFVCSYTPPNSCYCGLAKRTRIRIVGGHETEVNEYPWQVALWRYAMDSKLGRMEWDHWCGGSVISDQWVLSAAHCTYKYRSDKFKILLGEHNHATDSETTTVEMNIAHSQIIYHPQYNKTVQDNYDVLLIKLTSKIDFSSNSHIRPICLPVAVSTKDYNDYIATVTGWGWDGTHFPDTLQEVKVKVMTNMECSAIYQPKSWYITESMICAAAEDGNGDKDSCGKDSGGPLVTKEPGRSGEVAGENYELIGVVSWGPTLCAHPTEPGVYARVTEVMDWIKSTTGPLNTCPRT